jgi:NTE family protein
MKKIGLALGGGGAKGLAHLLMLEVLDELDITLHCIAGTSIGAVIGSIYAGGHSAKTIRTEIEKTLLVDRESWRDVFNKKELLKWFELMDINFRGKGLLKGDNFVNYLADSIGVKTFEELSIPLKVVTSDFWAAHQYVIESGDLMPAVKASMGLPGIFTPVEIDGKILVDGGGVNPVPHDLLTDCDFVIAIDVMGENPLHHTKVPNSFRAIMGMFDIMQKSIIRAKLETSPPDIYIKVDISDVDILDFYKTKKVYEQAEPARQQLKERLQTLLRL